MDGVGKQAPHLAGIVHLWSLDAETTEAMTSDALMSSAKLGCVGVLQLVQALAATDGLAVDGIWLVTRSAQPIDGPRRHAASGAISAVGISAGSRSTNTRTCVAGWSIWRPARARRSSPSPKN